MSILLSLETTNKICSVAIHKGDSLLFYSEYGIENSHAEVLNSLIDHSIRLTGISTEQVSAIAVSIGPGSYTGLRIGLSSAKGLAFAWEVPLIPVNTLQAMADQVKGLGFDNHSIVPMLDARRMEVFTCGFDSNLNQLFEPTALIVSEESVNQTFFNYNDLVFCGDGLPKSKQVLQHLKGSHFLENIYPKASNIGNLALGKLNSNDFADIAYLEPFYLKPFYSTALK
ncbi:MAG: tRNA (adenosine(37)-N6)-threonylcarbamoyltransferase complex dimerization subunit type 1 TsaB [Cytophagales bacterium]|nr:tRNA (adenosine(37)-N6)-threonylcarbamoyltransferase complex dimerization subunit type 1 TsaB [Cytophagales bacterium]